MITASDLTIAFPEFADASKYPVATINFWITQAGNQLDQATFGTSYDLVCMLFVAHMIATSRKNAAVGNSTVGAGAGDVSGPISSKSVGSVSKSIDIGSVTQQGAGFWNTTSYGVRYFQMIKGFATGPRYFTGYPLNLSYPGVYLPGIFPSY